MFSNLIAVLMIYTDMSTKVIKTDCPRIFVHGKNLKKDNPLINMIYTDYPFINKEIIFEFI